MSFIIRIVLTISFLFIPFALSSCSSSSNTMRYNSNSDENKFVEKNTTRYSSVNNTSEDSLNDSDEEVPEYQDPSDLPEEESQINIAEIMKKIKKESSQTDFESSTSSERDLILMEIIKYLNTPYKYGGNSLKGIDCSAFTQSVFKNTNLYDLNRSAREQFKQGIHIDNRDDLKFGDLVFFNTRRRVKPGHVGIYIGDNLFAHASSKLGVTISSLDYDYYSKRFMGARRLDTLEDLIQ